MKNNGINLQGPASQGQISEIQKTLLFDALPRYIDPKTALTIIGDKKSFIKSVRKIFFSYMSTYEKEIAEWIEFYKKYFDMDISSTPIHITPKQEGYDCLLIIPKGLTLERTASVVTKFVPLGYQSCIPSSGIFSKQKHTLDDAFASNDRTPNESYGRWVKDQIGSDMHKQSAYDLKNKSIYMNDSFTTLLEELVLILKCYSENKSYLEYLSGIICCGTRFISNSDESDVPYIYLQYSSCGTVFIN